MNLVHIRKTNCLKVPRNQSPHNRRFSTRRLFASESMRLHCTVRSTLGASWNVELGPAWRTSNFISTPHYKKVKNKVCTYTNERVHDGGELHLTGETGYRDGEVLLWRVVRCGRRREHGVVGACVEDGAEFILWIRAGGSTLKHPDRQSNADFGVNEVLSGIRSTLAPMRHVW